MFALSKNPLVRVLFISLLLSLTAGCTAHSASVSSAGGQVQLMPYAGRPSNADNPQSSSVNSPILAVGSAANPEVRPWPLSLHLETAMPAGQFVGAASPSDMQTNVKLLVDRSIDALFRLDRRNWLGVGILVSMLLFYHLEGRSPLFGLLFAGACWAGSAYAGLSEQPLAAVAAGIWGLLAVRKCWRQRKAKSSGLSRGEQLALAWFVRAIGILAVCSGVFLLIADSPVSINLPLTVSHSIIEAIPLLLVGIAYLAWLATEKPTVIDLIKQIFIAIAFILWGADLLMPPGNWARFVAAVVIAIYVFDLAWLIEGNLRKKLRASFNDQQTDNGVPDGDNRRWSGDTIGVHEGNGGSSRTVRSSR
jgi:hypothetical protein